MAISFTQLSRVEFSGLAPQLVDLYLAAMDYPTTHRHSRIRSWRQDCAQPGFLCVLAHNEQHILGFGYGYFGTPDHWWVRELRRGVFERGGPSSQERYILSHFFELAELHVAPAKQQQGIGAKLLQSMLDNCQADYMMLSTPEVPQEANGAFRLYRTFGFQDFLRNFRFRGDQRPFAVLYRDSGGSEH